MIKAYHQAILEQALKNNVSPHALAQMISANLGQDAWYYQFIHPHFHFDNNAFSTGKTYIFLQRETVIEALKKGNTDAAWKAFGRLSHAAQDFYAHSNYVALWLASHGAFDPQPEKIDPLDPVLLDDPNLKSGRFYIPIEFLYFIPSLRLKILPRLPLDSHAWMNMDDPTRPNFEYAYVAAIKRTRIEYDQIATSLDESMLAIFEDRESMPVNI
jgi:hypothetical protein